MHHKLIHILTIVLLPCFLLVETPASSAENLWYTVQAGSYLNELDAYPLFETLFQKLPADKTESLRIEKVGSYYTVRIGKSANKQAITPLYETIKTYVTSPSILHAYIRDERIKRSQLPAKQLSEKPAKVITQTIAKETATEPPQKLVYTVQVASFAHFEDAEKVFLRLEKTLDTNSLQWLRIEKIGAFHTIRIGKSDNAQDLKELLNKIGSKVDSPTIIKAYVRENRIVKQYSEAAIVAAPISKPSPAEQETPQQIKPEKTPETIAEKDSPPKKTVIKPQIQQKPLITKTPIAEKKPETYFLEKYLSDQSADSQKTSLVQEQTSAFAKTPSCSTEECHGPEFNDFTQIHSPAQEAQCTACHKLSNGEHPGEGAFALAAEGAQLCSQCHGEYGQGSVTHSPVAEGECLECHNPHGSSAKNLLTSETVQDLCFSCHDDTLDYEFKHGPAELGACTFCHNPHSSEIDKLLVDQPQQLCLKCHTDFVKGFNESPYIHSALEDQGCLGCHKPHGSSYPYLLDNTGDVFCFTCHEELSKNITKAKSKHAALYLEKKCSSCHLPHYSANKALLKEKPEEICFTCHGSDTPLEESYTPENILAEISQKAFVHQPVADGDCTSCHNPHGSRNQKLLIAQYPESFYAPYNAEQYSLCFTCHNKTLLTATSTETETGFRNGSRNLHFTHVGLERKGRTCRSCHSAHASNGPMLINPSGATFGEWTMAIDYSITTTGGSCSPGCHRTLSYDREKPVIYSEMPHEFKKSFIDYQSKR